MSEFAALLLGQHQGGETAFLQQNGTRVGISEVQVRIRTTPLPFYRTGAVLAVTAACAVAIAGCSGSSSSGGSGSGPASSPAAAGSPLDVVKLAAKTASGANSYTGTMSLQMTPKPGASGTSGAGALGNVNMSATFAEQLHPSLLASVNIGTLSAAGQSLPGGMTEIVTPSTLYLKWSFLTTTLHLSKPWLAIPLSSVGKSSGIDLSQIFSQLQSSGPLTESQLLAGASSVHQVGGVAVTEYTGTLPLAKGIQFLSGSAKTQVQQAIAAAGLSTATFTVWIDGQHLVRKSVVSESGKSLTEVITTTITSINQPVNVAIPPAGQTTSMPSSALNSGGI
jgi:Protein of unknown function (DUF1691)